MVAVYVGFNDEDIKLMEKKWAEWDPGVRLVVLRSSYRSVIRPLVKFVDIVESKQSEHDHVTILIP